MVEDTFFKTETNKHLKGKWAFNEKTAQEIQYSDESIVIIFTFVYHKFFFIKNLKKDASLIAQRILVLYYYDESLCITQYLQLLLPKWHWNIIRAVSIMESGSALKNIFVHFSDLNALWT